MRAWHVPLLAAFCLYAAGCGRSSGSASRTIPAPPRQQAPVPAGAPVVLTVIPTAAGTVFAAVVMRDIRNERGDVVIGKGSPLELMKTEDGRMAIRSAMVHGDTFWVRTPAGQDPVPLAGPARIEADSIVTFLADEPFVLAAPGGAR